MTIDVSLHAAYAELLFSDNKANRDRGIIQMTLSSSGDRGDVTVFMIPNQARALSAWLIEQADEMAPLYMPTTQDEEQS